MSIIDKVIGAVTPPESEEARQRAREEAKANAVPGSWLSFVLDHHRLIENGFDAVRGAADAPSRRLAQKQLAVVLNGHALAEEVVLYPALGDGNEKAHMTKGYTEQTATKVQMAMLEQLEPGSQDYLDKLEHIRGAVLHHMYEEEGTWFPELSLMDDASERERLTARYLEEYDRYTGGDAGPVAMPRSSTPSLATL